MCVCNVLQKSVCVAGEGEAKGSELEMWKYDGTLFWG